MQRYKESYKGWQLFSNKGSRCGYSMRCPKCGYSNLEGDNSKLFKYCPVCGTDMSEVNNAQV